MAVALVTGSLDHKIKFWDPASGLCAKTITFGDCQVNCLQISPDKRFLLAAGYTSMKLYDMHSTDENPVLYTYNHETGNILSVGFERDCKWIYSCGEDNTIRIWDLKNNNSVLKIFQPSHQQGQGVGVNCVCLEPNEQEVLISGDQNGYIKLWNVTPLPLDSKGKPIIETQPFDEVIPILDQPIRSIAIATGTGLVCVGSHRGRVFIYKLLPAKGGLQIIHDFVAHEDYLLHCSIDPRSLNLATSSADRSIKLWDLSNVNQIAKIVTEKKSATSFISSSSASSSGATSPLSPISPAFGSNNSASSSPNSASANSTPPTSCALVRTLSHHQRWVWDIVYSSESIFLVSASSDNTAKLWNVESGEVLRNLTGHSHAVTCVALNDTIR